MLSEATDEVLAAALVQNRETGLLAMAKANGRAEIHESKEILRYESDMPRPLSNVVFRTQLPDAAADGVIAEVLAGYRARGCPCMWLHTPESRPTDLPSRLVAAGGLGFYSPGMALDLSLAVFPENAPAGIEVREVLGHDEQWVWASTVCESFGLPADAETIMHVSKDSSDWGPGKPMRYFTAFLDSRPAATSVLYLGAGVVGLYCIGAKPEARRRGAGTAATVAPMVLARELGYRYAVLESSDPGLPLYKGLGFREVSQMGRVIFEAPSSAWTS